MKIYVIDAAELSGVQLDMMCRVLPHVRREASEAIQHDLSRRESIAAAWLALGALDTAELSGGLTISDSTRLPFFYDGVTRAAKEFGWQTASRGKPFPNGVYNKGTRIYVSISHSGGLAAAAVNAAPVGIDIQALYHRSNASIMRIAERLHPDERQMLSAMDEPGLVKGFTTLWAQKESILKLDGRGISASLHSFAVDPDGCTVLDGRVITTSVYALPKAILSSAVYV